MDLCTLCASPASVKDHETGRLYCGWHALVEIGDYPAVYFDLYYEPSVGAGPGVAQSGGAPNGREGIRPDNPVAQSEDAGSNPAPGHPVPTSHLAARLL